MSTSRETPCIFDKGCKLGYSVFFESFYNEMNSQLTNPLFHRCIIYHTITIRTHSTNNLSSTLSKDCCTFHYRKSASERI